MMANTVMALTSLDGALWLMRLTAAIPVGAVLGGIACQRFDYRVPAFIGLALAALGFWLMNDWDLAVVDPELTIHLVTVGLGFGLLIVPIALAATESVGEENRGTAAAMVTAARMVGMTLGLAALTAWGADRFRGLGPSAQWPFQLSGETTVQFEQRVFEYETQLTSAGMTLFTDFFLIAMVVCLIALLPAAFIEWNRNQ